jgi:hypothetical protein
MQLFPNPANQWITIAAVHNTASNSFIIIDAMGKKMQEGTINGSLQINIGDWANGIYNVFLGTHSTSFIIAR